MFEGLIYDGSVGGTVGDLTDMAGWKETIAILSNIQGRWKPFLTRGAEHGL